MFVLVRACEGLFVAHALIFGGFILGAAFLPWIRTRQGLLTRPQMLARIICTSAFGIALIGGMSFALASIGALTWGFLAIVYVGAMLGGSLVSREHLASRRYWSLRIDALRTCWEPGSLLMYYALLLLSIPAVIGNVGGSDPVAYHLVYPKEWANAHALVVDPYLRLPFYANNFPLLFADLMLFRGDAFVNDISLAVILLAGLGMYGSAAATLERRADPVYARCGALLLSAAVLLAPSNLRWIPTAYLDAPIGAFTLFSLLAFVLAVEDEDASWAVCGAVTAAFLIGMKSSFLLLAPLYGALAFGAAMRSGKSFRTAAVIVFVFIALSSPWYLRNVILAGDPAPPALNIALHGYDGLTTKGEWALDEADLQVRGPLSARLGLPAVAFFDPIRLREYGANAFILSVYLLPIVLLLAYARGRRIPPGVTFSAFLVLGSVAYWLATSSWLRYATIFYFLLPTALTQSFVYVFPRRAWTGIAAIALGLLTMIPSPGTRAFYVDTYRRDFLYLPSGYTSDASLGYYAEGYDYSAETIAAYKRLGLKGRVYMVGVRTAYYFYESGIEAIGDWMGPSSWLRLYRAIDAGQAVDFVRALDANAVLINPSNVLGALDVPLERQLLNGGFTRVPLVGTPELLYVRGSDRDRRGPSSAAALPRESVRPRDETVNS